jgi:hypothetical protein
MTLVSTDVNYSSVLTGTNSSNARLSGQRESNEFATLPKKFAPAQSRRWRINEIDSSTSLNIEAPSRSLRSEPVSDIDALSLVDDEENVYNRETLLRLIAALETFLVEKAGEDRSILRLGRRQYALPGLNDADSDLSRALQEIPPRDNSYTLRALGLSGGYLTALRRYLGSDDIQTVFGLANCDSKGTREGQELMRHLMQALDNGRYGDLDKLRIHPREKRRVLVPLFRWLCGDGEATSLTTTLTTDSRYVASRGQTLADLRKRFIDSLVYQRGTSLGMIMTQVRGSDDYKNEVKWLANMVMGLEDPSLLRKDIPAYWKVGSMKHINFLVGARVALNVGDDPATCTLSDLEERGLLYEIDLGTEKEKRLKSSVFYARLGLLYKASSIGRRYVRYPLLLVEKEVTEAANALFVKRKEYGHEEGMRTGAIEKAPPLRPDDIAKFFPHLPLLSKYCSPTGDHGLPECPIDGTV